MALMLVIDVSGSMGYTDPERLRETAAHMLVDLLGPEDYLGIVTFDHEVELMLPLQQLKSYEDKKKVKESLSAGLKPRGNTDYQIALEAALRHLKAENFKGVRPAILLLTDGEPDPDPLRRGDPAFMEAYMASLWETVGACVREGFPIYTVGFSHEIDEEIIRTISEKTGGECFILNDPQELLVSFFSLLGNLKRGGENPEDLALKRSRPSLGASGGWVEDPLFASELPELKTDLWLGKAYRQGEEVIVSAFMERQGKGLLPGPELKVSSFQMILKFEEGEQKNFTLHDDGSKEKGDIKASDGLWTGRVIMEGQGKAYVFLLAAGKYKGVDFLLEEKAGEIFLYPPGRVLAKLSAEKIWTAPKERIFIPLQLINDSHFTETLLFEETDGPGTLGLSRLSLKPGESLEVKLPFELRRNLEEGIYKISLPLKAEDPLTSVEPGILEFAVEVISPAAAAQRKLAPYLPHLFMPLFMPAAAGMLFYLLGLTLYCLLVLPGQKVRGFLFYQKAAPPLEGRGKKECIEYNEKAQKIKLHKAGKSKVAISFDPANSEADFYIEGSPYRYDLIIKNTWERKKAAFLQGWQALLGKNHPPSLIIECTMPGIIEYKGGIYTSKELSPNDEFLSGGFIFKYKLSTRRQRSRQRDAKGVNILEGRV